MVWRQEKVLRTNLQPNPSFRASAGYTTVRTNLVPGGFSVDSDSDGVADGWVAYTAGTVTNTTRAVVNGTQRIKATLEATMTSRCGVNYIIPTGYVTSGQPVQISVNLWGTFTTGQVVQVYIDWRDASGNITGTHQFNTDVSQISGSAKVFRTTAGTLPVNTVTGTVYVWVAGGTGGGTGDLYVDNLIVETASYQGNFFDGASSNGSFDSNLESVWTGTANASPSVARGLLPADWGVAAAYARMWQAEDGQSAYIRNVGTSSWANAAPAYSSVAVPATVGVNYSSSIKQISGTGVYTTVQGYNSVGNGTTGSAGGGTIVSQPGGVAVSGPWSPSSGTVGVRHIIRMTNGLAPGEQVRVTQAVLEAAQQPGTYFDGSYPSAVSGASYRWNGTAERSSSDMYIPALMSPPTNLWSSSSFGWAEPWLVDGMDIQSMAFGVETVDVTPPDLRGSHLSIPGMNGVYAQYNRSYEPGTIALKMWVLGCDVDGTLPGIRSSRRQMFERNVRMLFRLFGYQGNTVTLSKTIYGDYEGATPTTVKARAIIDGFTSLDTMAARQRAELTVTMTLVDSFWSDVNTTTDSTDASATMPKPLALSDVGTAPVDDSIITITGPITAPRVTCPASGSWIQYTGSVAAGQTLVIDTGAGTAKLNGNTSVLSSVTHGGTARFMVIPPRNSSLAGDTGFQTNLTLTGTGASSATKFSVAYNRKHLVIV